MLAIIGLFCVLGVGSLVFSGFILGDLLTESDRTLINNIFPFLMCATLGLCLLLQAAFCCYDLGRMREQEKAVKAGVASYSFNTETGIRELEYLKTNDNNND